MQMHCKRIIDSIKSTATAATMTQNNNYSLIRCKFLLILSLWVIAINLHLSSRHVFVLTGSPNATGSSWPAATTQQQQQQQQHNSGPLTTASHQTGEGATGAPIAQLNSNNQQATDNKQQQQQRIKPRISKNQIKRIGNCDYDKGEWQECQANGLQQRTLTLKRSRAATNGGAPTTTTQPPSSSTTAPSDGAHKQQQQQKANNINNNPVCEPSKLMTRECKKGCKYERGEWSATCQNGLRSRLDKLIVEQKEAGASYVSKNCQPSRKVTKKCKNVCHYIKSDWSACKDGVRQRTMTLDESKSFTDRASSGQAATDATDNVRQHQCEKVRTISKPCNGNNQQQQQPRSSQQQQQAVGTATTTDNKQQLPVSKNKSTMKTIMQQRRRQKQLQQQQQQQQQQQSTTTTEQSKQQAQSSRQKLKKATPAVKTRR